MWQKINKSETSNVSVTAEAKRARLEQLQRRLDALNKQWAQQELLEGLVKGTSRTSLQSGISEADLKARQVRYEGVQENVQGKPPFYLFTTEGGIGTTIAISSTCTNLLQALDERLSNLTFTNSI